MNRFKVVLTLLVHFFVYLVRAQQTPSEYFFHPDSLRSLVEVLASDSMDGRFTGSEGCNKAARFIAREFEEAGVLPVSGNNGFFMPVTENSVNVVAALKGSTKPQELIIFSAHYDHIGTIYTDHDLVANRAGRRGDKIYNGANDDASGVAAVISLARYFATVRDNERTILFVAFTGEELGLLGSQDFVSRFSPDSIVALINIEMIGREHKKSSHPYVTGAEYSNLFNILNDRLYQADAEKYGRRFFETDRFDLFKRSDNYSFALKGVPAHSIMGTGDDDQYYHSLGDEASTLNFRFMSDIVQAIALSCDGLVTDLDTPNRIKANL
jgi:Zn-dependent M28 family amino/carboxypeptidase